VSILTKLPLSLLALAVAGVLLVAPGPGSAAAAAPAFSPPPGILAGTWWKLSVSARGYRVDPFGTTTPASYETKAWMRIDHFVPDGPPTDAGGYGALYAHALYTETAPGVFEQTASDHFFVVGLDEELHETLAVNTLMSFATADATVAGRVTARLKLKQKDGVLKSATLKTIAGELEASTLGAAGVDLFFGELRLTGKTVAADELPFTP
jgi:hypothetical protein